MISFDQFARHLERALAQVKPRVEVGLAEIGAETKELAAEYIGHEMPQWAPLAESTIAEKTRLGFTDQVSPTDPLLRKGLNRDPQYWPACQRMGRRCGFSWCCKPCRCGGDPSQQSAGRDR